MHCRLQSFPARASILFVFTMVAPPKWAELRSTVRDVTEQLERSRTSFVPNPNFSLFFLSFGLTFRKPINENALKHVCLKLIVIDVKRFSLAILLIILV